MALRARLAAPPLSFDQAWPWHVLNSTSIPVSALCVGDRRLEAETYLSSGYGLRLAIEKRPTGWNPLSLVADVWQPNRLKGIQVPADCGTPFLAATQVFDARPIARKWLSLDQTSESSDRFVLPGMIVVTRSGSVGRPTLAYAPHENVLISDDLLRVEAHKKRDWGWIYAYLHCRQARQMMKSVHYGHIIKHLEISHLEALPIPVIDEGASAEFSSNVDAILKLRNESYRLTIEAEQLFERAVGPLEIEDRGESGFHISVSEILLSRRKRLDASVHNPGVATIYRHLSKSVKGFTRFADAGFQIWVPGRYKRIPAEDGLIYRDSADILEVSPDLTKRFADCRFGDEFGGRVKGGWILIPCSGQVYGIVGTATLATEALNGQVVSNHVMRCAPISGGAPAGYVLTALTHPVLGRPLVKSLAFGSSVPELGPEDVAELRIARLDSAKELEIAELAERSARARASADLLEQEIALRAASMVDNFIAS